MDSNDCSLSLSLESVREVNGKVDYRPGLTEANHHFSFAYKLFLLLLAKAGVKWQMDFGAIICHIF